MLRCSVYLAWVIAITLFQTISAQYVSCNNEEGRLRNEANFARGFSDVNSAFINQSECFECFNHPMVIPRGRVCDGIIDCPDLSDECLCENNMALPSICNKVVQYNHIAVSGESSECEVGQVDCGDGVCIDRSAVCDSHDDCPCGADEQTSFCHGTLKEIYSPPHNRSLSRTRKAEECNNDVITQMPEEFQSENKTEFDFVYNCTSSGGLEISIYENMICDFNDDCMDQQDEIGCSDGRFYCEGGVPLYVRADQIINNHEDCRDWSDECPTRNDVEQLFSRNEIIGNPILRGLVWVMAFLATVGNLAVMISEFKKIRRLLRNKSHGPVRANHVLILNLSFADFLMGVYLFMLGIAGAALSGKFCESQLTWCSGMTCHVMGSLVVISSETSVVTMIILTLFRLFSVCKPLAMKDKPTLWTIVFLTWTTWAFSFSLALVPVLPQLQKVFADRALVKDNPFFSNVIANFDEAQSWSEKLLTYDPYFASQSPVDVSYRIHNATSWSELRSALGDAKWAEILETDNFFGYYSAHSICIPRLIITEESKVWQFSITVTAFNFFAFLFVACSYLAIAFKASRKSSTITRSYQHKRDRKVGEFRRRSRNTTGMQKKIFRIIATDFCCWVPISILSFLSTIGVSLPPQAHIIAAVILLPINSALNPIIYSDVFGRAVAQVQTYKSHSTASTYANKRPYKSTTLPETSPEKSEYSR